MTALQIMYELHEIDCTITYTYADAMDVPIPPYDPTKWLWVQQSGREVHL